MINSNILHLTYTLVGTVDSAHESACIPNPVAFKDLLAGMLLLCVKQVSALESFLYIFYVCVVSACVSTMEPLNEYTLKLGHLS